MISLPSGENYEKDWKDIMKLKSKIIQHGTESA